MSTIILKNEGELSVFFSQTVNFEDLWLIAMLLNVAGFFSKSHMAKIAITKKEKSHGGEIC